MTARSLGRTATALILGLIVLMATGLVPAHAGTLSSASLLAPGGRTYTGAQNTGYAWAFTTTTASTLSRVSATVPMATGQAERYLSLPATAGNDASTPDSAANSITGDIDIRVKVAPGSWANGTLQMLASKTANTPQRSWLFHLGASGGLGFSWSENGVNYNGSSIANALPFANGSVGWVRVTLQADDGAGRRVIRYYTSNDGLSWTPIGFVNSAIGTTSL